MEMKAPLPNQERETTHHNQQQDATNFWSVRELVTYCIKDKLSNLPPSHTDHCIYRVPDRLRKLNEQAFTPRFVAIGPLHRLNPRLKPTEELKLRFLKSFFCRTDRALAVIDFIVREESTIRRHYEDEIPLKGKDFSEMFLLDSAFIVELLLKKEEKDPMFETLWLRSELLHDMLLLENQIPLYLPHTIYDKFYKPPGEKKLFPDLVNNFIKEVGNAPNVPMVVFASSPTEPRHFIEYLKMAHKPDDATPASVAAAAPPPSQPRQSKFEHSRSASVLQEYGVKFVKGTTTSLVEIQYKDGVLTIPQVKVNEWTEPFFRNLIALEQCQRGSSKFMTDYIIFMDSLIDTLEDVDVLSGQRIIEDDFNDPVKVRDLFNNLHKETITDGRKFYFAPLSNELNAYSRDFWHRWMAKWYKWKVTLKKDYFNSPWSTISFIAAVILLALTIVQTFCSIYAL